MYSITICDDDREFAFSLHGLCSKIMTASGVPFRISISCSLDELTHSFQNDKSVDLLILDIKFGERNGIDFARSLREQGYDTSIVLMSCDSSYLLEGYTVQPIYFLLKPVTREKLENAIAVDLERRRRSETVTVKCGQGLKALAVERIIYLEVMDHALTIHSRDGDVVSGLTLTQFLEMLPQDRFCRCHKSYAVHLGRIKSISRTDGIILESGQRIPVGRKYYEDLRHVMIEFANSL